MQISIFYNLEVISETNIFDFYTTKKYYAKSFAGNASLRRNF